MKTYKQDYSKQLLTTKLIPYNNLQEIIQYNNWQKVNTNIFRYTGDYLQENDSVIVCCSHIKFFIVHIIELSFAWLLQSF